MHYMLKLTVFLLALFVVVQSERKVTAQFNPGCEAPICKKVIVYHVKAEGQDDTLHHFWDFTGKPTLTLVLTETNATVTFNWQRINFGQDKGIIISSPIKYIYGLIVDKFIEFNDEHDTGSFNESITNSSYVTFMDTTNLDWKVINKSNSSGEASLSVEASGYVDTDKRTQKNGTVRFVVSAFGGQDHAEALPHLLHSGNTSQVDITLDGLNTGYKNSRFGLHLITASSERSNNKSFDINFRKTMDDEHAPGVFTIVEMRTPAVREGGNGGYLQWRPVVYTSPAREMTASTDSVQYSVTEVSNPISTLNNTLLYSLLGNQVADMLVATTYVTFGSAEDGFYDKKRYMSWTMLAGYGHPPEESFSMLVTLVLLIGLGLPALLILVGTVCIVVRRLNRNQDSMFLGR